MTPATMPPPATAGSQATLLAAIADALTAACQQWRHRMQVARREARDSATARGLLDSSVRYSLEGRAITTVVDELVPETARLVEHVLQGTSTVSDLPSADQLLHAVETPIRALIDGETADLLDSPKRRAFASSINQGAIRAAIAGIEPALAILRTQVATLLRNRQAQLVQAQAAIDAAKPLAKSETPFQRALRWINVARSFWWVAAGIAAIALWAWNGFPIPI